MLEVFVQKSFILLFKFQYVIFPERQPFCVTEREFVLSLHRQILGAALLPQAGILHELNLDAW